MKKKTVITSKLAVIVAIVVLVAALTPASGHLIKGCKALLR